MEPQKLEELISEYFEYRPQDGAIRWKKIHPKNSRAKLGERAGFAHPEGYWQVALFGKKMLAHRLAFFLMTGQWPKNEVDHINLDRSDNRWENLREATSSQNKCNRRVKANSTSGAKGVVKRYNRWGASISSGGKYIYLGSFATKEMAIDAYNAAAIASHGEYARAS